MADTGADAETIAVYDARGDDYARLVDGAAETPGLASFMKLVRPGGTVLDLGCGPGGMAAILRDGGFAVTAVDASSRMVELAGQRGGFAVRRASFEDSYPAEAYDGIWAAASLLHVPEAELPDIFARVAGSLKPGGTLYCSFKESNGLIDRHGRHYAAMNATRLAEIVAQNGLERLEEFADDSVGYDGVTSRFIAVIAAKRG